MYELLSGQIDFGLFTFKGLCAASSPFSAGQRVSEKSVGRVGGWSGLGRALNVSGITGSLGVRLQEVFVTTKVPP